MTMPMNPPNKPAKGESPEIFKLDAASQDPQVQAAVSACIAEEVKNGKTPEQASAMCYAMASRKTGKKLAEPNANPNQGNPNQPAQSGQTNQPQLNQNPGM